jgi:hypothetical protein
VNPNQKKFADRRHSDRFPIEREVHYRVLNHRDGDETGDGITVNISSSGVLFTTETRLPVGRRVELSVSWPAKLDDRCPLKLMARGRVVRLDGDGRAAIEIHQYEFRTQSQSSFVAGVPPLTIH